MAKFIGMKQKAGEYKLEDEKTKQVREGEYHNFYMHYVDEAETKGENLIDYTAYESFIAKIKAEDVSGIFGFEVKSAEQFNDWFLKDIEVLFNRKGNVVSVRLVEDSAKKLPKGN